MVLLLPDGETKASTGEVYAAFDARGGSVGYEERRGRAALGARGGRPCRASAQRSRLVSAAEELRRLGAFRADVSGAGPAVYGLFADEATAEAASGRVEGLGPGLDRAASVVGCAA